MSLQNLMQAGRMTWADVVNTAGLVCLELFKVVQSKQVEAYRNTFVNLALPLFAMAEPIAPKVITPSRILWCCTNSTLYMLWQHILLLLCEAARQDG